MKIELTPTAENERLPPDRPFLAQTDAFSRRPLSGASHPFGGHCRSSVEVGVRGLRSATNAKVTGG